MFIFIVAQLEKCFSNKMSYKWEPIKVLSLKNVLKRVEHMRHRTSSDFSRTKHNMVFTALMDMSWCMNWILIRFSYWSDSYIIIKTIFKQTTKKRVFILIRIDFRSCSSENVNENLHKLETLGCLKTNFHNWWWIEWINL